MTFEELSGKIEISIHAPLTGSDIPDVRRDPGVEISIHAPLTGSDSSAPRAGR